MARALPALVLLAACADGTPLVAPAFSPIGEGSTVTRTALPVTVPAPGKSSTSLYGPESRRLLTDVRAQDVGDVLTVVIAIDESAEFENETERERDGDIDFDFDLFGAFAGRDGVEESGEVEAEAGVGSQSRYRGQGAIDRSEKLRLSIAALVTEVLPNGNLIVSGQQEVRVNREMRVLRVAGVVNPLDITRFNTVSYEKIAEARISYGGKGRVSEIQNPNWGQQIYDRVVPF